MISLILYGKIRAKVLQRPSREYLLAVNPVSGVRLSKETNLTKRRFSLKRTQALLDDRNTAPVITRHDSCEGEMRN